MNKLLFGVIGVQMHKPAAGVTAPDRANHKEYGHYLMRIAACGDCHSLTEKGPRPESDPLAFAGSDVPFEDPGLGKVYASNITGDPETGLGRYSADADQAGATQRHPPRRPEAGAADVDPDSAHLGDERGRYRRARGIHEVRCRRPSASSRNASWARRFARSSAADERDDDSDMSETVDQPPPPSSGEDWSARIEQLLTEAEAAPSVAERADVLCRVAEIYERRLGDPNGALVTLQAALEQDPTSGRVVQEMERVARSSGCWKELVAITAEVAGGLEDPKQAADLWVQIAFWSESGLGMPDEAANAARAALNLAPNHGGALALLEDLYKRQRNWDSYVEILNAQAPAGDRRSLQARGSVRRGARYEPTHAGALAGLARICEETRRLGRRAPMRCAS